MREIFLPLVLTLGLTGRYSMNDDKAAIEALVRESEEAFASLDCAKVDDALAPGAKWIENSPPQPAENAAWCTKAKAAGIRITYRLYDFDVQVHNDVAWVTLMVDGSFSAGTPEARELMGRPRSDPAEWTTTAVESIVLQKIGEDWKMLLGHSSVIRRSGRT